jgi:cell division septum initiation protein DivIVA
MPDVQFMIVLRGYDPPEVDELIRQANPALASTDPAARSAVEHELRQPELRTRMRGYDRAQVHARLAILADQLAAR